MLANVSRPTVKRLQSQLNTQLESSDHSDSSEELPPTPPSQLLRPGVKNVNNYIQESTAQHVASHASQQGTSPTVQRVASPTAPHVTSNISRHFTSQVPQQGTSPSVLRVSSPTAQHVASHTSKHGTGHASQQGASPSVHQCVSPTCEAMFTKILTILEELKETRCVHGMMLNALLKKQDGSVIEVPEGVVLPLKTQADLEALDQKLEDRSVMAAVVSSVIYLGIFFSWNNEKIMIAYYFLKII